MKRIKLIIYLILVVAAVALFMYMYSDEAKVKRVFSRAASLAEKDPSETVLEGAMKAENLSSFFAQRCIIRIPELYVNSHLSCDYLKAGILSFRSGVSVLKVKVEDLVVEVKTDDFAFASGVVDFMGSDEGMKIDAREKRQFSAELQKDPDGEWRFSLVSLQAPRKAAYE